MKVLGLDDKEYTIKCKKRIRENCSLLHKEARSIIHELFPLDAVYEEISVPGLPTSAYFDFFIWRPRIAFEIQGEQHYHFIKFFHGDRLAWAKAKKIDGYKREWCEKNNIQLIELPYDCREQWRERIANR
jgi:hypothetical protein